jgi:hypothetical protein
METNISGNTITNCSAQRTCLVAFGANVYGGGISVAVGVYSYSSSVSGNTTVSNTSYTISSNTLTNCSATSSVSGSGSSNGANVYGGGISVAVGAYSYSFSSSTVSGSTTVSNTSYIISSNILTNCSATSSVSGSGSSNGANVYGGGISLGVGAYSYCSSPSSSIIVSGDTTVSNTSYTISSNTLTKCSATSSSFTGVNVNGGGISVAVGAYSYGSSSSTVSGDTTVSNTSYTISSNTLTNCSATSSASGDSPFYGANVYGGGISVAVGAYSYSSNNLMSSSIVSGSTTVSNTSYTISSNTLTKCKAASLGSDNGNPSGANLYGGGISVAVGAYSYSVSFFSFSSFSSSTVSGSTTVSNTSYTISSNTLTNCSAASSGSGSGSSNGANVYGGGISVAVGVYSYSSTIIISSSTVSGNTTVSNTSYAISSNILTNCSATSSVSGSGSSNGANLYGGGISFGVGAYSYSSSNSMSSSTVSGDTTVSNTSYTISSNTLTNCSATSLVSGVNLNGANLYGGGISVAKGAYSYSFSSSSSSSNVSGDMTVSNTSYIISSNTMTGCSATLSVSGSGSSNGANVYGGGISVAVGAYSYGPYGSSSSIVSGDTTVSNTSYIISSNTLTSCSATSSGSDGVFYKAANVYGGGISVAKGAYSYSSYSNTVSGTTTVINTGYTISSNTLTNCRATSSGRDGVNSNGANVNSGGISVALGAYSYSSSSSSSIVSGSTTVSNTSYTISSNTLTNCSATSSGRDGVNSNGANVNGGGISVALGAYSYSLGFSSFSSSSVSGNTTVSNTRFIISSNILTYCSATSSCSGGRSSNGGNVYGGGISVALGAYSYSVSISSSISMSSSSVSGSTTVSNTSYIISSNILTNCSAASSVSGSGSSNGANVYGGGISVAVGAYSYSFSSSTVSGSTTVSNTSYIISSNILTNCSATSSGSGSGSSNGANVYGGGISVAKGAYSYSFSSSSSSSTVSGDTTVSNTSYIISSNTLSSCSVLSKSSGTSNGASAYGGAFSLVHNASSFPLNIARSVTSAIGVSSVLRVDNGSFSECKSTTSSVSCASGASNAAGGAVFALVPSLSVEFFSSYFSNSSTAVQCAAFSSSTYSLGGGMSIFQAGSVNVTSTNFTGCRAQGVPQSNNVFVSGGGIHIQASDSFVFQNGSITNCSVLDAFSTFLQSGGGALSTQNASVVQISDSIFRDNSDFSFTGGIFMQQLKDDRGMNVTMDRTRVLLEPSTTPALNISCGSNCSQSQQQRINIRFQNFSISAHSEARTAQYDSSAMLSLPTLSVVDSDRNSSLNCLFNFTHNGAILFTNTGAAFSTFSCAPCARSFEIAQTSRTLELSNVQNVRNLGQRLCQPTASSDLQQCPFGVPFCSTTVNVSVGFWASFSADGKLGSATRCPPNYCGCRNIPNFNDSSCLLEPPFSPTFQSDVRTNDNLCNGNRCGVLCGGCKPGFTQSLNGYSCISNEECAKNVGWTWAVTIIGHIVFSIYIVYSTRAETQSPTETLADTFAETPAHTPADTQVSDSLISCVLFYGQMSSFAIVSPPSATSAETRHSAVSSWSARVSQFSSITSLYSRTCFGPNMSAYAMTAAELCGPAIVLFFSLAFAFFMKLRHKNRGKKRFSILATLSVVVLLIFSSVATVVFKLVTCAAITIDDATEYVVFIDGSVKCNNGNRSWLLAVAVLLCLFPVLYAAALRHKDKCLSDSVLRTLCGAFKKEGIYWGVVTSIFRLVMSIVFAASFRNFPSTVALIQLFLCVAVLILLTFQKPYRDNHTYYFDILCHATLIFQFGFAVLVSVSESLGVSTSDSNPYFETLRHSAAAVAYLRYVSRCLLLSSLHCFIFVSCCAFGSYIMFMLGITLWLILHRTSIYENMSFCYRTIYDKVSLCYRSLKGYGKARFDNHCFACFYRFKDRFLCCKRGQPSAHDDVLLPHHR